MNLRICRIDSKTLKLCKFLSLGMLISSAIQDKTPPNCSISIFGKLVHTSWTENQHHSHKRWKCLSQTLYSSKSVSISRYFPSFTSISHCDFSVKNILNRFIMCKSRFLVAFDFCCIKYSDGLFLSSVIT